MPTKKDIRFQRVESLIYYALIQLLHEKSLNQITVQDICERAKISRSGFYLHYVDKHDLIEKYIENIMKVGTETLLSNIGNSILPHEILNFFNSDGKLLALLISDNGSLDVQKMILSLLVENAKSVLLTNMNIKMESDTELRYLICYLSNASFGVVQEWVNSGQKESPEELAVVLKNVMNVMKSLYE